MKFSVLLLLLLAGVQIITAQTSHVIKGYIYDVETGNPVGDVNVYNSNLKNGTISSSSGAYSVRVTNGDTLVFSHVGYRSQNVAITEGKYVHDVVLEPSLTLLPTAEVRPVVKMSYGMLLDVSDYAFIGDAILYYGYCYRYDKEKNPWLVLLNESGDTIATYCTGVEGKFFRDCMNNLHYLTATTASQIYIGNDGIVLLYPSPVNEFLQIVEPCKLQSGSKLLFAEYAEKNQILMYYYADTITRDYELFRTIADEIKLEMLAFRGLFFSMGSKAPSDADLRFEEMMFDSVFAPVIKMRDTIALINYTDSVIEWYDYDFRSLGKVPVQFHNNRYIENEILVDEATGKVYAVYLRKGKTTIRQLFINSGTLGKEIPIPDFSWVGNLKVYDDQLYFLYREKFSSDFQALYRMNLR